MLFFIRFFFCSLKYKFSLGKYLFPLFYFACIINIYINYNHSTKMSQTFHINPEASLDRKQHFNWQLTNSMLFLLDSILKISVSSSGTSGTTSPERSVDVVRR